MAGTCVREAGRREAGAATAPGRGLHADGLVRCRALAAPALAMLEAILTPT